MELVSFQDSETIQQLLAIAKNGWTVPVGMGFLYFYGLSRFNSPSYAIELPVDEGTSIRLITQTPPKLTTTRSRYRLYATSYIIILIIAFLALVFLYPTVKDAAIAGHIAAPNLTGPLQQRVFIALFLLTGVLTSFPVLNKADKWLLGELHKRALIPDESRYLARRLYQSEFKPTPEIFSNVRESLSIRDIIRVADRKSKGELEQRIIAFLCLKAKVHTSMDSEKYREFKIQLEKDFDSIESQTKGLSDDVKSYLRWQTRVIPEVNDIDDYISSHEDDESVELLRRRGELIRRSNALFETMCLIVALAVCATNVKQSDAEDAIKELGFTTQIGPLPIFDLDTVVIVTGSSFLIWVIFATLYSGLGNILGISSQHPELFPARAQVLKFSILLTVAFAIVMSLAIKLKRHWRARRKNVKRNEAVRVAIASYFATVWLNIAISYVFNGSILNQLPYMFAINQAVL
jgi:hypothetical protein